MEIQNESAVSGSVAIKRSPVLPFLKVLLFITFCLISLGGAVRAMNAGLACPDWPLCFGKVIPEYDLRVYYEFIHRAIAGVVGIGTLVMAIVILSRKEFSQAAKKTILVSGVILLSQIVLGGLTVLKLLHFGVVTAHLAFGMLFFSSLLWLFFVITDQNEVPKVLRPMPTGFFGILTFAAIVVYAQILLGGLVSSQYAGVACPDFPLCNGEVIPTMVGDVGIHMTHRLGAYFTVITLLSLFRLIRKFRDEPWVSPELLRLGGWIAGLVLAQVVVGVINVLYKVPPVITTLHLAIAAAILGSIIRMFYLGLKGTSPAFIGSLRRGSAGSRVESSDLKQARI